MIPTGTNGGVRIKKSVQEKEADWKVNRAARAEMQKNRQIRELQDLITEQRNCLDAARAEIDEMLRKTQMNLSSLSEET